MIKSNNLYRLLFKPKKKIKKRAKYSEFSFEIWVKRFTLTLHLNVNKDYLTVYLLKVTKRFKEKSIIPLSLVHRIPYFSVKKQE